MSLFVDGGGWTQIHYVNTDAEGYYERYAEVFSTVEKGTFSSSTSYSRKGRLLLDSSNEFRYTRTNNHWSSNYASNDVKCDIDAHFRDAIKNPVTRSCGNTDTIHCYDLTNDNAPITGYEMNNQHWTGSWNVNYPRIWIGNDRNGDECHGNYAPFGVVTWKSGDSTQAVHRAFQTGNTYVAFWVR